MCLIFTRDNISEIITLKIVCTKFIINLGNKNSRTVMYLKSFLKQSVPLHKQKIDLI